MARIRVPPKRSGQTADAPLRRSGGPGLLLPRHGPGRGDGGGVESAPADVQAEENVDAAAIDHAEHPSVVLFTRRCHGADRHIHIMKSLPAGERPVVVPLISGLSAPPELVTPPPGRALDKGR